MCTLWKNTANTLCWGKCLENYDQALLKGRCSFGVSITNVKLKILVM